MNRLNYEKVFKTLVEETGNYLVNHSLRAMVLGVSGGIDSTVVAAICCEVNKQTNIPLIGRSLPIKNKKDEFSVSELVGKAFCNDFAVCPMTRPYHAALLNVCIDAGSANTANSYFLGELEEMPNRTPIANGNLQARCRMIHLYDLAGIHGGLVMSTDNQTEYRLGFWTIHGDVGDFDPIQDLWKTEVYQLAEWLKLFYYTDGDDADKAVAIGESIKLTPTDGLGISNSDLDQIGAKSYYDVDRVLQTLTCKASPENDKLQDELTAELGPDVVGKITERHFKSRFKRLVSPIIVPREMYD